MILCGKSGIKNAILMLQTSLIPKQEKRPQLEFQKENGFTKRTFVIVSHLACDVSQDLGWFLG